jgi:hypothetical protein
MIKGSDLFVAALENEALSGSSVCPASIGRRNGSP